MRLQASNRLQAALITAAVLATTACVQPDAPGVAVAKLQSEIVFGVKEAVPEEVPAPNITDEPVQPALAVADLELPPPATLFVGPPPTAAPKPRPALRAATTCPAAALNAFPEEAAPLNVPKDRLPKEGLYRWKKSGTSPALEGLEQFGPQTVTGFEQRIIRAVEVLEENEEVTVGGNVVRPEGKTFEYEMVLPDLSTGGLVAVTYQVKTNGRSAFADDPIEEGGGFKTAGEPERGVVLKRITPLDGSKGDSFEPATGLLLLPLGIRPGETFRSAAVDPRTGQTLEIDAKVMEPDRIDACGEIIEGWKVEGILRSNAAEPVKYTYIIAPHLGAVFLQQQYEQGEGDQKTTLTFTLGQKDPGEVAPQQEG